MYTDQNNERKYNESQSILICNSLMKQPVQQTVIRIRRPTNKYNSINTKSSKNLRKWSWNISGYWFVIILDGLRRLIENASPYGIQIRYLLIRYAKSEDWIDRCLGYETIMFHIYELYSIEIDRNKAVNCECWEVRVGKKTFELIVSCYVDIHM
jgi:hypothetical protein